MADLILKQIWNWLSEGWNNMADLADRIDDLICSFEGGGDTTMDTVAMLMFGWMIFGLVVLAIGRYIYGRYLSAPSDAKATTPVVVEPKAIAAAATAEDGSAAAPAAAGAAAAAPKEVAVKAAPVRSSGGPAVPPTPPVRKRITTRRSTTPTSTGGRTSLAVPPTSTGPDTECVQWVNDVFYWLYTDLVIVNEIINVWIQSMNEFMKNSVTEHGVGVEFVRTLPETHPPSLSNVFSECNTKDDVTITCDCEAMPALQLKAFRQKGEKVEVSHYRVNINRLRARLNIVCRTDKLIADVKCDGWPDIKVALAPVGAIKSNLDEQQLQDVINEIVVGALRGTVTNLNLGQYPTCPRLNRQIGSAEPRLPVHYDSLTGSQQGGKISEKRLLVKVIKAVNLGAKKGCTEPYCVVEMDEPPQKNQTSIKKNTNNPVWDEHFLFDLSPNTAELLFEIYDRANKDNNFLGLGIVGVEELLINPSQRQVISLQSRPYEADEVSGMLTVEFLFIEGADIPMLGDKPFKLKETLRTVSPSGGVITTTKTVFENQGQTQHLNGGDVVTDSALKELELRNRSGAASNQANKSTLIIHSVQRQPQHRQLVKVEQTDAGEWHEVPAEQVQQLGTETAPPPPPAGQDGVQGSPPSGLVDDRGRSRRKKRDFFGTIKRRLGRSKTRSKSMDPAERDESLNRDASLTRSISADRARDPSAHSAVPGLIGVDGNSTRSSLSEASGISGASTRTYVNEASTLVLETIENGVKKHYLVPLTLAQKSKWRKKGTKLHIFNDHTFIAKHLAGGTICQVCTKALARRLGKQGYECRDCQMKCHKHCHIKVDTNCTNSTIQNIELSLLPVLSE